MFDSTCSPHVQQLSLFADEEIWLPIATLEGRYAISNHGRVRSFLGKTERVLKPISAGHGYMMVCLCDKGKILRRYVHRLVLSAFVGTSDLQANHKNGQKDDNRLVNLEYVTSSENLRHAKVELGHTMSVEKGTKLLHRRGEKNGYFKLSDSEVAEIRRLSKDGLSCPKIAQQFGVSRGNIWLIVTGKTRQ
jgi:hypothetical protein